MARGAFIVFEGADRSGKTTQTKRCTNALRAAGVQLAEASPWRFPDRTTQIGQMINAYLTKATDLDDNALHLLFAANRWEKANLINAALARGETVIVDRYAFSGVAYSVAKGLSMEWCKLPDAGLPAPDLVVYLDLSIEKAAERGGFGAERYENHQMQRAVAKVFASLKTETWCVVDADADEDTVFSRVMNVVTPAVALACQSASVSKLW